MVLIHLQEAHRHTPVGLSPDLQLSPCLAPGLQKWQRPYLQWFSHAHLSIVSTLAQSTPKAIQAAFTSGLASYW